MARHLVSICRRCGVRCAGDDLKGYLEWWHLTVEPSQHNPDPDPTQTRPHVSTQEPSIKEKS